MIRIFDWEHTNKYWLTDQPREPNPGPCPCCEIELPTAQVRLNAVDDYGNFCTLGFSREDYEKFKQTAWTVQMMANQRLAARIFRLSRMHYRT
jgi:hypothetical protein